MWREREYNEINVQGSPSKKPDKIKIIMLVLQKKKNGGEASALSKANQPSNQQSLPHTTNEQTKQQQQNLPVSFLANHLPTAEFSLSFLRLDFKFQRP